MNYVVSALALILSSTAHSQDLGDADEWRDRLQPNPYSFSERRGGLATAGVDQTRGNSLLGVIDLQNHWIIAPQFQKLEFLGDKADLFAAGYGEYPNYQLGIRNTQDQWVIQPKYSDIRVAPQDRLLVALDSKWGLLDLSGSWILQPEFESLAYAGFEDRFAAGKNGKVGIVNSMGEWIIPAIYSTWHGIPCDRQGFCRVTASQDHVGLVGPDGNVVVAPNLYRIEDFHDDLAVAATAQGVVGVINRAGQWVVAPQFTVLGHFSEGHCAALGQRNGKSHWGYIDAKGEWVLSPQFQTAEAFHAGQAIVSTPQGFGIINRQGKWLRAPDGKTGVITFVLVNAEEKYVAYRIDTYTGAGLRTFNGRRNIRVPLE